MSQPEKFRLNTHVFVEYSENRILAKIWGNEKSQYEPGDCYILAIKENTDPEGVPGRYLWSKRKELLEKEYSFYHDRITSWRDYSEPMTIEEIEKFISFNEHLLGRGVNNCYGTKLEEEDRTVHFGNPIYINSPLVSSED